MKKLCEKCKSINAPFALTCHNCSYRFDDFTTVVSGSSRTTTYSFPMEPQRLFQEVRDRLICLEHFKETRPEKLAATDIAKLLKAVDLMNDTLRYYALVQDDLAAENTLEAIRLLSEAKAEEEGE